MGHPLLCLPEPSLLRLEITAVQPSYVHVYGRQCRNAAASVARVKTTLNPNSFAMSESISRGDRPSRAFRPVNLYRLSQIEHYRKLITDNSSGIFYNERMYGPIDAAREHVIQNLFDGEALLRGFIESDKLTA